MATFMERFAFLQKVPTLMKATADDENPCPGYLFQEIGKISHESLGCGQCLLEYLLERLQVESCHVKLKVLKIFVHLCGHGSNHFLTELRRNSTFIQQASVYSGPPDPIHGTAMYQKVRSTAQEVAKLLFTDTLLTKSGICQLTLATATIGMGSATSNRSGMQGFGYSPGKQASSSDSILDKIQKAAEVVASAVLPPIEHQGIRLHDNYYRAVVAPSAPIEVAVPACAYNLPARTAKAVTQRCPGQVGGGWEETDSGNSSSHNSSQDITANSRASLESKSAGTGSQSGVSRESNGDLSERVEALQLGDCGQEVALINKLTEGSRVFLSREESLHFIKECSTLNCEVVVELLSSKLQDPSNTIKMRALCAIACLMTSDLLSLEQMFDATQRRLRQLSEGPPGPVGNKATKILRQFEALMGGLLQAQKQDTAKTSHQRTTPVYPDPLLPVHSAHTSANLNHVQPCALTGDDPQEPNRPALPSVLALTQRVSSDRLNDTEDPSFIQQEPVSTLHIKPAADRSYTPPCEAESKQAHLKKPSLFCGMELVTKGRPLCEKESSATKTGTVGDDLKENSDVHNNPDGNKVIPVCESGGNQTVSAFTFLNF